MAITPSIWQAQEQLNASDAGDQLDPTVAGLTNGNYVVIWDEPTGGPIGTSAGADLVGQIFDFLGNPVGAEFQVNQNFFVDDERGAQVAAMPGGGFVVVHEDANASGTSIRAEVYDANGALVPGTSNTIQADTNTDVLRDPAVATRPDGSYLVVYQRDIESDAVAPDDQRIVARFVDAVGVVGAEFQIFQTSDDVVVGKVAALSDGNFVVTYQDADDITATDYDPQFAIVTAGGVFVTGADFDSGANMQTEVRVTALTGGGFVGVWTEDIAGSEEIRARVYNNAGAALGAAFTVNTTTAGQQDDAAIAALSDGGFLVAWESGAEDFIRAQRFDATGTPVGVEFLAGDSPDNDQDPAATELSDGRILVAFEGEPGAPDDDIVGTIFDPRGSVINGTAGDDKIAARLEGGRINGLGGNGIMQGFDGNDVIDGGLGNDRMQGGAGDDNYYLDNRFDFVFENAGEGTDTMRIAFSRSLAGNMENLILTGTDDINGVGRQTANIITGNSGDNRLRAGSGNDTLNGGRGEDLLAGDAGNDRLIGGSHNDFLTGGKGADTMTGSGGRDLFDFNLASESGRTLEFRDIITDFQRNADDIDLRSVDANTGLAGNNIFSFIGEDEFSGDGGEVRIRDLGSQVLVQVEVNGDTTRDFEILARNVTTLTASDFLL
ncbi:MAG: calcium-binding protein [Xanthobacteraceae bacterium]